MEFNIQAAYNDISDKIFIGGTVDDPGEGGTIGDGWFIFQKTPGPIVVFGSVVLDGAGDDKLAGLDGIEDLSGDVIATGKGQYPGPSQEMGIARLDPALAQVFQVSIIDAADTLAEGTFIQNNDFTDANTYAEGIAELTGDKVGYVINIDNTAPYAFNFNTKYSLPGNDVITISGDGNTFTGDFAALFNVINGDNTVQITPFDPAGQKGAAIRIKNIRANVNPGAGNPIAFPNFNIPASGFQLIVATGQHLGNKNAFVVGELKPNGDMLLGDVIGTSGGPGAGGNGGIAVDPATGTVYEVVSNSVFDTVYTLSFPLADTTVPEFSLGTMLLAILVAGGLMVFVVRRRYK
jgi:hypothetical protein